MPNAAPHAAPDAAPRAADTSSDDCPAPLPDDLAEMPPGAWLCELLDETPTTELAGGDVVEIVAAAYRQLCRQQGVFFQAVLETALRAPYSVHSVERLDEPSEFAADEVRARLVWSRARAESTLVLAYQLFIQLPQLGAAMLAGELDLPRARAFLSWTEGLSDEHAHAVADQLLPDCGGSTVGELIDQIKRACLAIDPDWAEGRYREAVRQRRVRRSRNPDGTGNLSGYDQPADRVVAATARIDALARECKRCGDRRGIDLIRSDLFLRMLDGSFEAMTDSEIVAHVLAEPLMDPHDDPADYPPGPEPDPQPVPRPDGGPEPDSESPRSEEPVPQDDAGHEDDPEPDDPEPDDPEPDDDPGPGGGWGSGGDSPDPDPQAAAKPEPTGGPHSTSSSPPARSGHQPVPWSVPELRAELMMLLGHNDHPAHIPGWDYIPAQTARGLVARMQSAQWRWVVCGPDGRAVSTGLTRARPSSDGDHGDYGDHQGDEQRRSRPAARDPRRGGIVELAIPATDLACLLDHIDVREPEDGVADPAFTAAVATWRAVITDIAGQHNKATADGSTNTGDDRRRIPTTRLRRWLQVRDRACAYPNCRVPASQADIDHRVRWADNGGTDEHNCWPLCRHDHRLKDEGGWTVEQRPDGTTVWISPLGQRVERRPPPVIPRPMTRLMKRCADQHSGSAPQPRGSDRTREAGQPHDADRAHHGDVPQDDGTSCECIMLTCPHDRPAPERRNVNPRDRNTSDARRRGTTLHELIQLMAQPGRSFMPPSPWLPF